MQCTIRPLATSEYSLLKELTYQAIYQRDPQNPIPRTILDDPSIRIYYEHFGQPADMCLVAEIEGQVAGGVWTRILDGQPKGFGHIDAHTPEFGIALFEQYRGRGIGTQLMHAMLALLKQEGYLSTSLAVQKDNDAVRMYQRVGFGICQELEQEYLMRCSL